jgi:hypothetical protein
MSGRLTVENYRGARVPRSLGIVLAASAWIGTFAWAGLREAGGPAWGGLAGCLMVFGAGLVDDLLPGGPRGLRGHVRELARGRVTTGIVKLVVIVGASVVVLALQPTAAWWVRLSGVVLLAGAANVWNGLDVRPGRAAKAFVPIGLAFVAFGDPGRAPAVLGLAVGALVVLPYDLTERAMLGDGGANLLGFAAGLGLFLLLPAWAVPLAAAGVLALNAVAETLTLSRAIAAVPPLRWLDERGRRLDWSDR